ncbi:Hypothetical protein PHPALM_12034 [Phytophthora palmivora]|uniref:PiggyBac transposable element-derived protein domain-containing protein n=1 Tax=Phytophthora palmivora TaxID=4796 RepID=A0A2P4Y0T3_9STRA|nr:Hypothetical protein PHPALM_12034 [Phytophthora palmivora]
MQAKQTTSRRETLVQIRRRQTANPTYHIHEIVYVIGLLVGGTLPAGTFGGFMSRNRCQKILHDVQVVDNEAPQSRDKLWKLCPVVAKLQQQFLSAWLLPAVFPFDESVRTSTSLRNTTRIFYA